MIKISLDEAYVFDLLSIYSVKIDNSKENKRELNIVNYESLQKEIVEQIGVEKFNEIIQSQEYKELKISNQTVFDLVDRANENELAKITAQANYQRYIKKIELQKKFFGNSITEVKLWEK